MQRMANVPIDVVNIIKEMACKRQCNHKKGRDFVIRCCVKTTHGEPRILIGNWLYSRLELINHPAVFFNDKYYWNIIGSETQYGIFLYKTFLIHLNTPPKGCDKLIITDEEDTFYEMSSNYLLEFLSGEPPEVVGIGVSAVSPVYMAKKWWDIVNSDLGLHRMLPISFHILKQEEGQKKWVWSRGGVRQNAMYFGWKNYPPNIRNEQLFILSRQLNQLKSNIRDEFGKIHHLINNI